jgi:hypothetical protein
MEGVTMYLDEPALRETLSLIASHAAGTRVVFDFVSDVLIEMIRSIDIGRAPPAARPFLQRFLHLTRDEPWRFGLPLRGEREYIEAFGFDVPEILTISGTQAAERYLTRADGSEVGGEAMSRVPTPTTEAARQAADAQAYRIAEAVVATRH